MKTKIEVFNIDSQKHVATVPKKDIDTFMKKYREIGYSVFIDQSGDLCIDKSDEDEGLTYLEQYQKMLVGRKIYFNKGEFLVTYFEDDEIRIKRTTEPKIEVSGEFKDGKIKLMGWNNYLTFKQV